MNYFKIYIKSYIIIYIIVIASLLTGSCTEILFSDDEQVKTFTPGKFNAIVIDGTFDIKLVQDSADLIILNGSNSMSKTEVSVLNDTLMITDRSGFNPEPGRNKLEIHFTGISFLETRKSVNVTNYPAIKGTSFAWNALGEIVESSLDLDLGVFIFCTSANTLGLVNLQGKAETLIVFNRYGNRVSAGNLLCKNADIANESAGYVYVNASETLVAYLLGNGNIYYYGDPAISINEKKGLGNLIRMN
ncbi:MAG TPA: DUF2807 domain-containing protein [Bacteroidales bacterium]|nr:DUF2807 domain-containing protein [Bacteroidales bacterium]